MFKRTTCRALHVAFRSDLHGVRMLLAMSELIWAVTLFWPGDTFGRPTYSVMAAVAPEWLWGLIFLATAVVQWRILISGHYHGRFAVSFAAFNSLLWWFVVVSMYLSVYPPPAAISGELALAFGAAWVWVRSGASFNLGKWYGN